MGVDTETWFQVPVDTAKDNRFHFEKGKVVVESGDAKCPGGDGTVHSKSAMCPELAGTHYKRDRKKARDILAGHHANMPNHDGVQDWALGVLNLNLYSASTFDSPV